MTSPLSHDVAAAAPLQEIFSSIQGEGVHVGKRQIFVRFAHCHLKCAYCDTPMTSTTGLCHVEHAPGSGETELHPNPVSAPALIRLVSDLLATARHHSISLTGGEPLLYHRFLRACLPELRALAPIYLETSGTQPEFLAEVLPWTDIIAMDIKLPSATGEASQFDNHRQFYRLARAQSKAELYVKLVFNERTTPEELAAVREIVEDRDTPLILQPETDRIQKTISIRPHRIFEIESALTAHFHDVRVIPQTHKMLNVL